MEIENTLSLYKSQDTRGLFEKISTVINEKNGKWDSGIESQNQELTAMLVYEYATSIEKISKGKLTAEFVIEKLAQNMGTFRYGDFKPGQDDNILYDNQPVTSEEYKKHCRINANFGAHQVEYEEDGKKRYSVALYDDKQQYTTSDGITHTLSGIRLDDIDDIRHTVFHEWTHVMEKNIFKGIELTRDDLILQEGDSTYINVDLGPDLKMEGYKDFIENVDSYLQSDKEIVFSGYSTIEINERKDPNRRIMHNIISEGATELISQMVLESLGIEVRDKSRYEQQTGFARQIFESLGIENAISEYFTASNNIIKYIESKKIDGKSALHYANNHFSILGKFEKFLKDKHNDAYGTSESAKDDRKVRIEEIKNKILDFFKTGKEPDENDVVSFEEQINALIPLDDTAKRECQNFLRTVLNYPRQTQHFRNMMQVNFPARDRQLENVIHNLNRQGVVLGATNQVDLSSRKREEDGDDAR